MTIPADAVASEMVIGSETRIGLDLQGMHCGSCAALIEEVLGELDGVHEIVVDLDHSTARVTYDAHALDVAAICAEVAAAGYEASERKDSDAS